MSRFKPIKVNFVAWHFRDCIPALSIMSTIERGIYFSLCVYLYEAGGRLPNKTSVLASLSGFSPDKENEFVHHFNNIKYKFVPKSNYISHKRCMTELLKSDKLIQAGRKGGLLSAKTRKMNGLINNIQEDGSCKGASSSLQLRDETNTKQDKKDITNTSGNLNQTMQSIINNIKPSNSSSVGISDSVSDSSRPGDALMLYGLLQDCFIIKTHSDKSWLENICKWAVSQVSAGYRGREFYNDILRIAQEVKANAKRNRYGYMNNLLKRDFGYIPPSKQN